MNVFKWMIRGESAVWTTALAPVEVQSRLNRVIRSNPSISDESDMFSGRLLDTRFTLHFMGKEKGMRARSFLGPRVSAAIEQQGSGALVRIDLRPTTFTVIGFVCVYLWLALVLLSFSMGKPNPLYLIVWPLVAFGHHVEALWGHNRARRLLKRLIEAKPTARPNG